MVQVTTKTQELELKMSEEKRVKDTPGGIGQKMSELQTVRFEWPGIQVGSGPEIMIYKSNQRSRPGDMPQGMQPVPAIWLTPPRGAPWQYSGLADNNLANGRPEQSTSFGWHSSRHFIACAGLVVFLLLIMRYAKHYWPQLRLRSRRKRYGTTLHVTCQLRSYENTPAATVFSSEAGVCEIHGREKPPSYSEYPEEAADTTPKTENSFLFSSGNSKNAHLHVFDTRRDCKIIEGMSVVGPEFFPAPRRMYFNIPNPNTNKSHNHHLVIDIIDVETDDGCVLGLGVSVDKESRPPFPALQLFTNDELPVDLKEEALMLDEEINYTFKGKTDN